METHGPVVILAVFGVVLAALIAIFSWGAKRRSAPAPNPAAVAVWSEVAKRLGGKLFVSESGAFRVRFKWDGRDAALYEDALMTFKIEKCDFAGIQLSLGTKIARGHGVRFLVENQKSPFLSPPVRKLLDDLAESGGRDVTIDRRIRITGKPAKTAKDLVRFAVLCFQLAQHAKLFADKDERVRVVESIASSSGECQICGASLEGTLVRCARCSTPHHADCWEYAGICSTYGCGEKTFVA